MFVPSTFSKVQAWVERAARELILRFAFAGLVICGERIEVRVEIAHNIQTLATDGKTIWCNPDYLKAVYKKEGLRGVVFRLLHEYLHCFFNHPERGKHRDRKAWGYAIDVIVNRMCCEVLSTDHDTWVTPADGVDPAGWEQYETAEEVYDELMKNPKKMEYPDPVYTKVRGEFTGGDLREPSFENENKKKEFQELLGGEIMQAQAIMAMKPGSPALPGIIAKRLEKIKEGKIPWSRLLTGRLLTDIGDKVATFSPPRKRTYPWLIQPSMKGLKEKRLMLLIDGSSSVGQHLHKEFQAAVKPAARKAFETHIVTFDQVVREHVIIKRVQEIDKKLEYKVGRHSYTSVKAAFDLVDKVRPSGIACLTDGYIELPPYKPAYKKTVWCTPIGGRLQPWGTNFVMDVAW